MTKIRDAVYKQKAKRFSGKWVSSTWVQTWVSLQRPCNSVLLETMIFVSDSFLNLFSCFVLHFHTTLSPKRSIGRSGNNSFNKVLWEHWYITGTPRRHAVLVSGFTNQPDCTGPHDAFGVQGRSSKAATVHFAFPAVQATGKQMKED